MPTEPAPGGQGRDVDSALGERLINVGAQLLAFVGFEGVLVASHSASNTSRTAWVSSKSSSGNSSTMHAQSGSRVPATSFAASSAMLLRQFVVGLSAMERTVQRKSDSKTRFTREPQLGKLG